MKYKEYVLSNKTLVNELNELKGINIRMLGQSRTVSRAYTETTCGICFQKKWTTRGKPRKIRLP